MTITPGIWDLTIRQGGSWDYTITWTDQTGAAINLTGYSAKLQARTQLSDSTPFLDMSTTNGQIVLGGTAGTVQLLLSPTQSAALTPGTGVYDLKLISAGGTTQNFLIEGTLTVQQMSTQ